MTEDFKKAMEDEWTRREMGGAGELGFRAGATWAYDYMKAELENNDKIMAKQIVDMAQEYATLLAGRDERIQQLEEALRSWVEYEEEPK